MLHYLINMVDSKVTCAICLEDIDGSSKKLYCNHEFHSSCISQWLSKNSSCPNCRKTVQNNTDTVDIVFGSLFRSVGTRQPPTDICNYCGNFITDRQSHMYQCQAGPFINFE